MAKGKKPTKSKRSNAVRMKGRAKKTKKYARMQAQIPKYFNKDSQLALETSLAKHTESQGLTISKPLQALDGKNYIIVRVNDPATMANIDKKRSDITHENPNMKHDEATGEALAKWFDGIKGSKDEIAKTVANLKDKNNIVRIINESPMGVASQLVESAAEEVGVSSFTAKAEPKETPFEETERGKEAHKRGFEEVRRKTDAMVDSMAYANNFLTAGEYAQRELKRAVELGGGSEESVKELKKTFTLIESKRNDNEITDQQFNSLVKYAEEAVKKQWKDKALLAKDVIPKELPIA